VPSLDRCACLRRTSDLAQAGHTHGRPLFFFVAEDGAFGHQLWRTDGTTAGTFQVSQFPVGQGGIGTGSGFDAGGMAVFVLDHYCTSIPPHCSWRNYVSDGSVEGSGLVEGDLEPWTAAAVPAGVLVPGCIEGCPTGLELALIDREDRSVRVAANFEPEIGATTFNRLLARESELYFSTGTRFTEPLSWFLPSPLQAPIALPSYGWETPAVLENLAGTIVANESFGNQLFTWDPNAASWHPLPLTYTLYGEEPVKVVTRGGRAYLRESESSQVVWETDGTDEGTRARIAPGLPHYAELVAASGSHLFFREPSNLLSWWSLRLSDDTALPFFEETGPPYYRPEIEAVATASRLYFTTLESGSLELLRHSDGTAAGTGITWTSAANERVLDLFPVGDALYFLVAADRLSLWSAVDGGPANRVAELGALAADPDDERRQVSCLWMAVSTSTPKQSSTVPSSGSLTEPRMELGWRMSSPVRPAAKRASLPRSVTWSFSAPRIGSSGARSGRSQSVAQKRSG
jgi:ELWxxDGT repeat protein